MTIFGLGPEEVFVFISKGGLLAGAMFFIFALYKKWVVFGWQLKDKEIHCDKIEERADYWQEVALRSTNLAETLGEISKWSHMP